MTDPLPPDEPDVPPPPNPLRPLTKRKASGALYTRSPEVENQNRVALTLEPEEVLRRARITDWRTPHPDYLKEECLVYLIDAYRRAGDLRTMKAIHEILLRRCQGRIERGLRKLGPRAAAQAAEEVIDRLQRELLDAMHGGAMLQAAFGRRLKCLLMDVYAKYDRRRKAARAHPHVPLEQMAGEQATRDEAAPAYGMASSAVEQSCSPEALFEKRELRELVYDALAALPDARWKEAVVLYHIEGHLIDSKDPQVFTLCKHFGKSEKTIRIWINEKALPFLRAWVRDHA